jgi:hypothetical protein
MFLKLFVALVFIVTVCSLRMHSAAADSNKIASDNVLYQFDYNQNRGLENNEFNGMVKYSNFVNGKNQVAKADIDKVFNNLDSNKNGVIESTELRGVLSSRD